MKTEAWRSWAFVLVVAAVLGVLALFAKSRVTQRIAATACTERGGVWSEASRVCTPPVLLEVSGEGGDGGYLLETR